MPSNMTDVEVDQEILAWTNNLEIKYSTCRHQLVRIACVMKYQRCQRPNYDPTKAFRRTTLCKESCEFVTKQWLCYKELTSNSKLKALFDSQNCQRLPESDCMPFNFIESEFHFTYVNVRKICFDGI